MLYRDRYTVEMLAQACSKVRIPAVNAITGSKTGIITVG
jgi:hypothetical protein